MGSGLSPNGMGFCPQGMLSTALLDKVISVDNDKQQVTVQAGARVQQVLQRDQIMFVMRFYPHEAQSPSFCMQSSMQ